LVVTRLQEVRMTRKTFLFYPETAATTARSFCLDWNVAARLCSLYEGQTFIGSPEMRDRLLDLAARMTDQSAVIAGFAATEPEARPDMPATVVSRMTERAVVATAMLEQGHAQLSDFLDGTLDPKQVILVDRAPGGVGRVDDLSEIWVQPGYVILLKALTLAASGKDPLASIDEFRFWLNFDFRYRPSREVWLGMLLIGGNGKGKALVENLLKTQRARTRAERIRDLWGASWDVFYTRLVGMTGDVLPEFPRPVVFVSDDEKLIEAVHEVELAGVSESRGGNPLGHDYVPIEGYFDQPVASAVQVAINDLNSRVLEDTRSAQRIVTQLRIKARHERPRLEQLL